MRLIEASRFLWSSESPLNQTGAHLWSGSEGGGSKIIRNFPYPQGFWGFHRMGLLWIMRTIVLEYRMPYMIKGQILSGELPVLPPHCQHKSAIRHSGARGESAVLAERSAPVGAGPQHHMDASREWLCWALGKFRIRVPMHSFLIQIFQLADCKIALLIL